MTRSELVTRMHQRFPHLSAQDLEKVVDTVFDTITETLANHGRVELRGFGAFGVKKRAARSGRNPRTGEPVAVEDKVVPFFKPGKMLRDQLIASVSP